MKCSEMAYIGLLNRAPVAPSDATGVRRVGALAWAHVASAARLIHYTLHPKRGAAATEVIGILPGFTGGQRP